MTVLDVIQRSAEFLAKKGVDSPRLQIELLLAHVLRVPRLKLYLDFERPLTAAELESVRELVKRRGDREPLQHILGAASFCGLEIKVNRRVLVPRPETELLAQRAWEYLGSLKSPAPTAFDFGTGSGCLAVALAAKCPAARVHAADISTEALTVARENAGLNRVADRIQFHLGDGFAPLPPDLSLDLIAANPPYVPSAEIDALTPEVRDYDPRLALDGGADGLVFFRRLAAESAERLAAAGRIMLEFGDGQAERIGEIFVQHKWVVENVEADYSGRPRILVARPERA
ncbi:MAG TPA: peptide chain release factor N(5)-glutamine methyltransferase [Haliangiales bacterium]|nr:peptide chain release factor N(5)-glutamine methyltransferase [Haliangiales bacterium]